MFTRLSSDVSSLHPVIKNTLTINNNNLRIGLPLLFHSIMTFLLDRS